MATCDMRDKLEDGYVYAETVDLQAGHNIYVRGHRARVVDTDYPLIFYVFEGQEEVKHRSFAATPYQFTVSHLDRELHATEAAEEEEDNDSDSTSAHPADSDDANSSDDDHSERYSRMVSNTAAAAAAAAAASNSGMELEDGFTESQDHGSFPGDASSSPNDTDGGAQSLASLGTGATGQLIDHISNRPVNQEYGSITGGEHKSDAQLSQSVRFTECKEAIFEVPNKVASVELEKCTDVTIKLSSVFSSVEISNCNDCRVECSGSCLSFVIEKSIGCEIQLVDSGSDVLIMSTATDDTTVQILEGDKSTESETAVFFSPSSSGDAESSSSASTTEKESESAGADKDDKGKADKKEADKKEADKEEENKATTEVKSEEITAFPVTYIIKEDTSDLPEPTAPEPGFEFITKFDTKARKITTSVVKRSA